MKGQWTVMQVVYRINVVCMDWPLQSNSLFVTLSQVRESVINRSLIAKHHFILSDVVSEDEVPSIG